MDGGLLEKGGPGRRIRAARGLAGMSQQDLADVAGVSWVSVSNWERGVVMPGSRHLLALGRALGRSVEYLLWTGEVKRGDVEAAIRGMGSVDEVVDYVWALVVRLQ